MMTGMWPICVVEVPFEGESSSVESMSVKRSRDSLGSVGESTSRIGLGGRVELSSVLGSRGVGDVVGIVEAAVRGATPVDDVVERGTRYRAVLFAPFSGRANAVGAIRQRAEGGQAWHE